VAVVNENVGVCGGGYDVCPAVVGGIELGDLKPLALEGGGDLFALGNIVGCAWPVVVGVADDVAGLPGALGEPAGARERLRFECGRQRTRLDQRPNAWPIGPAGDWQGGSSESGDATNEESAAAYAARVRQSGDIGVVYAVLLVSAI